MYHQALDSSAQTTTLTAQMPRPFVRGYDRQEVSRAQGGGVYIKGHSRMNGEGFLGMKSVAEAEASAKRAREKEQEAYAKLTPQQRLASYMKYEKEKNKSIGQKMGDSFSKPFTKKRGLMSLF